jgi:hypothetical protein
MPKRLVLIVVLIFAAPACAVAQSTPKSAAVSASRSSDQVSVEVTAYNQDLALIKETRKVSLAEGQGELRFMDVASAIIPETVHVQSLTDPDAFKILEQNYEYDLMDEQRLLDKYVGKDIKIIEWKEYQDRKDTVDATLLSNNNGQIYRINGEIFLGHPGYKVLPEIPENLISRPTLMWLYENGPKPEQELELTYLTTQIQWKADYVAVLDETDTALDLSGWVTLDNQSGATYPNASLKLIAGDVHRAAQPAPVPAYERMTMMAKADASAFEEKAFFEYHIYDLNRKTTIKDRQSKQISLLEAQGIPAQKEYVVDSRQPVFYPQRGEDGENKVPVDVKILFENKKEKNLGMPLPAGTVRFYKKDDKGSLQFVGEDRLEHTPKDEEVRLKIGRAFDITAERRQTGYRQLSTNLSEFEWEIKLRNHKESDVRVTVIEPLHGNWEILDKSHEFEKVNAQTIHFKADVPKDGETTIRYRARIGI